MTASPSPTGEWAPLSNLRPAETLSCAQAHAPARTGFYTHGGTVNGFLNAFMTHLHLYEGVAVAAVLAAIAFLIFLFARYAQPYRANPRKPAPRRG